jgi:hypothetical protein
MRRTLLLSVSTFLLLVAQVAGADYAETVLQDGPIAYYRFEEPDGSDEVADSSGNGFDGFEINNVGFARGGICNGSAAEFFGDSSIVLDFLMDPADPEGDGIGIGDDDFTIETWVYTTSDRDQQVFVAQKDGNGLGRSDMLISLNLQLGSYIGGATRDSGVQPELETWYHFVMAVDGVNDELYFYVNGEPSEDNPFFPANGIEGADGFWVIGSHKNQAGQFYEGLLDEIAFYDYRLDDPDGNDDPADSRVAAHYQVCGAPPTVPGDYDGDGQLTADDIDRLSTAIRDGLKDPEFDVNGDGDVTSADHTYWVEKLKRTWFGDANMDFEFSSTDFVDVFIEGKYELDVDAGWAAGDWTGDARFNSEDFIQGFIVGGYEQGRYPQEEAVQAVPEPTGLTLLMLGLVGLVTIVRRN